jgi:hypothetical protein
LRKQTPKQKEQQRQKKLGNFNTERGTEKAQHNAQRCSSSSTSMKTESFMEQGIVAHSEFQELARQVLASTIVLGKAMVSLTPHLV